MEFELKQIIARPWPRHNCRHFNPLGSPVLKFMQPHNTRVIAHPSTRFFPFIGHLTCSSTRWAPEHEHYIKPHHDDFSADGSQRYRTFSQPHRNPVRMPGKDAEKLLKWHSDRCEAHADRKAAVVTSFNTLGSATRSATKAEFAGGEDSAVAAMWQRWGWRAFAKLFNNQAKSSSRHTQSGSTKLDLC